MAVFGERSSIRFLRRSGVGSEIAQQFPVYSPACAISASASDSVSAYPSGP